MNGLIKTLVTAHLAERDARRGVNAKEARLQIVNGLSPEETDRQGLAHQQAVQTASDTGRRDELRDDLRRLEDVRTERGGSQLLTVALVAVWGVEYMGALLLLKAMGLPDVHRYVPALALTMSLILLTKATAGATRAEPHVIEPAPSAEGTDEPAPRPTRRLRTFLIPAAYGVLVAAIALARVVAALSEDGPLLLAVAEAVVLLAITIGPAFAAVALEEKRRPAAELDARIRTVRARLRREERAISAAERHLLKVDRAAIQWREADARGRAAYATSHEIARVDEIRRAELDAAEPPSGGSFPHTNIKPNQEGPR